LISLI